MASSEQGGSSPFAPLLDDVARMRKANLTTAIDDVDKIIELLTNARDQVAKDNDAHRIAMTMTALQNPVKTQIEEMTNHLKEVTKAQKAYGKSLDKVFPSRELPVETDAMANHTPLINRALAMHFFREGHFSVASTFLTEEKARRENEEEVYLKHLRAVYSAEEAERIIRKRKRQLRRAPHASRTDVDGDELMGQDGDDYVGPDEDDDDDESEEEEEETEAELIKKEVRQDFPAMENVADDLLENFSDMYLIINELKQRRLDLAITWARKNKRQLDAKGSHLEFELCKLQYIWLFKGPRENGLPDDENNGPRGARAYALRHMGNFQARHAHEIQQLACALVFASNLSDSPYSHIFQTDTAFDDVAVSFTHEFCSLLGLSDESPLYMAVTAGSIALPRLIKYTSHMRKKRTEWTSENELAFETPLPKSLIYHPIFVCPVSKEQTTEGNPPMMLTCGHVICRDSLQRIVKGTKYKCPYCPTEGVLKDAVMITF